MTRFRLNSMLQKAAYLRKSRYMRIDLLPNSRQLIVYIPGHFESEGEVKTGIVLIAPRHPKPNPGSFVFAGLPTRGNVPQSKPVCLTKYILASVHPSSNPELGSYLGPPRSRERNRSTWGLFLVRDESHGISHNARTIELANRNASPRVRRPQWNSYYRNHAEASSAPSRNEGAPPRLELATFGLCDPKSLISMRPTLYQLSQGSLIGKT
ncbi:hypothetical protein B0J17DRAFT_632980 [Rhizoctonia solani]|nr:hypothetical protein B0J17DRAFT_632980 [Rhizoctonia solani]